MFPDFLNKLINNLIASLIFFPLGLTYAVLYSKGIEHPGISIGLFVCGVAAAGISLTALERRAILRSKISPAISEDPATAGRERPESEALWNVPPMIDFIWVGIAVVRHSQVKKVNASVAASVAILVEEITGNQEPQMKVLKPIDNTSANVPYLWGTPLPFSIAGN